MLQHRGHDSVVGVCGIAVPVDPDERKRGWQSLRPRLDERRARIGIPVAARVSDDPATATGAEEETGQRVLAAVDRIAWVASLPSAPDNLNGVPQARIDGGSGSCEFTAVQAAPVDRIREDLALSLI